MSAPTIAGVVPAWTLADRLRKAREFCGLNQTELGDLAGISRRAISRYEAGEAIPRRPQVIAWAMATGVALAWLEDGECAVRDSNPEPADSRFDDLAAVA